jgi:hypothetical protein
MPKKTPPVVTSSGNEEEMVVTVVRFRGSGESVRKGIDALTQAFTGAFGAPPARQISAGRKVTTLPPLNGDAPHEESVEPDALDDEQEAEDVVVTATEAKPTKKAKQLYTFMTGLNLSPDGKTPWKAYATSKKPEGFNERLIVASSWLQTEGGVEHYAGGELFTLFRAMDWPPQADMTNPMRKLKSSKSYYDNPEFGKWRLTQPGLDAASAIGAAKS